MKLHKYYEEDDIKVKIDLELYPKSGVFATFIVGKLGIKFNVSIDALGWAKKDEEVLEDAYWAVIRQIRNEYTESTALQAAKKLGFE